MKIILDHFDNTAVIETDNLENSCNDGVETSPVDPLEGVETDIVIPKFYKLNDIVFAEPLPILSTVESLKECTNNVDEITFIGNIGVQKKIGMKNNKYFIDIQDFDDFTCPQQNCTKKFNNKTLLKAHIRKVHCANKNSYICELCGAGFSAKYLLKRHAMVHGDDKVKCPVCDKLLSLRTNLSTHLRSHADVRPHACDKCHKRFLRKCTLRRHIQFVHREET